MTNNTPANDTKKFSGICQVCGRRQAVNAKGNIAKHGYSLEYGFFNGTCRGSDNLPFEQDKTLAVAIIRDVHDSVNQLRADAVILEAPAVPEADGSWMAWVCEYKAPSWARGQRSGGHFWHRAPVVGFETYESSFENRTIYNVVRYVPKFESTSGHKVESKKAEIRDYENPARSESDAVTKLNAGYASSLRRQADGLVEWVKWQETRVASWKVLPLEPRK